MKASRDNLFTDAASGTARNFTLRQMQSGEGIISARRGRSKTPPTPKALATRERFFLATRYAKSVQADEATKALYAAAVKPSQSVYLLAVTDMLTKPSVHSIDALGYNGRPGDMIMVRASDDFTVNSVELIVRDAQGAVIERGFAVPHDNTLDWLYTATAEHLNMEGSVVTAIATDLPRNQHALEVTL